MRSLMIKYYSIDQIEKKICAGHVARVGGSRDEYRVWWGT